ncbi:MAG: fimbrillin family protein [Bacteroidales bacterium]|nr:fimbrillin family protein [Bacteroidales bacterium]
MKKFFLFATLVGVALTSCVKDELSQEAMQQQEITFAAPVVTPSTKAVNEVGTDYTNGLSFGVWGFYYANGYDAFANGVEYMPGNATGAITAGGLEISDNSGVWKNATNTYYWPKNGSLTFNAYAPYSEASHASVTAKGIQFTDYDVTSTANVDLLYSERIEDKTANDNTGKEGVDVVFKHALSSIRFAVKTADTYTGTTITLTGITLKNVYSVADFNQGLTDAADAETPELEIDGTGALVKDGTAYKNFLWSGWATQTDYSVASIYSGGVVTATPVYVHNGTATATENVSDLILLPQDLTNVVLSVDYTITNPGGTVIEQNGTISLYGNDGVEDGQTDRIIHAWERGKRYTYTISIGLTEIKFDPTVTPWVDITVGGSI